METDFGPPSLEPAHESLFYRIYRGNTHPQPDHSFHPTRSTGWVFVHARKA